jgi:hypothetical protein
MVATPADACIPSFELLLTPLALPGVMFCLTEKCRLMGSAAGKRAVLVAISGMSPHTKDNLCIQFPFL